MQVTPTSWRIKLGVDMIRDEEHKRCIYFMGLKAQGYKQSTDEWNRIAEDIKKKRRK